MKSTIISLAVMASTVLAQPHHGAPNHEKFHKRAGADDVLTVWDVVTETVDVTTTVWVTAEPSSSQAGNFFQTETSTTHTVKPASTTTSAAVVIPTTSSTPVVIPTTMSSVVVPVVSTSTTPIVVVPTTTSTPVVVVAPTTTSIEVPTTTSAAPVVTTSAASSGGSGSGSVCPESSPCAGDITYYTAGLGACGWTNDGDSESVVALPYELMGTQSNGNPYCGMSITVLYNGKSTTAKVVDKCMGCTGDSIDLSNMAFEALADLSVGRTQATWYFN